MPINSITISGNLTEDPKRPSRDGKDMSMVTCNLAHNIKDSRNGDSVMFFKLVKWDTRDGQNAFESFCKKGTKVVVTGRLKIWENVSQQNGNKYQNNDITVDSFDIMTPRDGNGGGGNDYNANQGNGGGGNSYGYDQSGGNVNDYDTSSNSRNNNNNPNGNGGFIEDDVPF